MLQSCGSKVKDILRTEPQMCKTGLGMLWDEIRGWCTLHLSGVVLSLRDCPRRCWMLREALPMGNAQSGNQGMQQSSAVAWHVLSLFLGGLGKGSPAVPFPVPHP